jgi:hypothetical protein
MCVELNGCSATGKVQVTRSKVLIKKILLASSRTSTVHLMHDSSLERKTVIDLQCKLNFHITHNVGTRERAEPASTSLKVPTLLN